MPISAADQQILNDNPRLTPAQAQSIYAQVTAFDLSLPLTPADRLLLEKYEGRGNNYQAGAKVDEGLVHQFYTPYILCKKAYDLAAHYGFTGGAITEPSCGTGRFFKFAQAGSTLTGFDVDKTNARIASALYPQATIYHQEFETAFLQQPNYTKASKKSWLPPQDLVIGNPPYGDYQGYYKSYMPKLYSRFEFLFIRLGLQLLKPGGLLVYIVSQNFLNNGSKYNAMKENILEIGQFVDAVRLPGKIFAATDIGTDIVIFKRK